MDRLQHLQELPIFGNADDDRDWFALAHEILVDLKPDYDEQIAALAEIDRTMGVESGDLSQEAIDDYLGNC